MSADELFRAFLIRAIRRMIRRRLRKPHQTTRIPEGMQACMQVLVKLDVLKTTNKSPVIYQNIEKYDVEKNIEYVRAIDSESKCFVDIFLN